MRISRRERAASESAKIATISRAKRSDCMRGLGENSTLHYIRLISICYPQDVDCQVPLVDHDPSRIPSDIVEPRRPCYIRMIDDYFIITITEESLYKDAPKLLRFRGCPSESCIGATLEECLCKFAIEHKKAFGLECCGERKIVGNRKLWQCCADGD